jgi:hypothetical protein
MVLLLSLLLMLAALAGLAVTVVSGTLFTVDGLFFSLISGLIFLIFAANTLAELRSLRLRRARTGKAAQGAKAQGSIEVQATPAVEPAAKGKTAAPPKARNANGEQPAAMPSLPRLRPVVEFAGSPQDGSVPSIEGLAVGDVLVREGILKEGALEGALRIRPFCPGWQSIAVEGAAKLERPLREAGLEIFFLVGVMEESGIACSRVEALGKAVAKLAGRLGREQRNAAEIKMLRARSLLGLHYVAVVARPCQIQGKRFILEAAQGRAAVAGEASGDAANARLTRAA